MEDRLEGCQPRFPDPHLVELAPSLSFLLTFSGEPSLPLEDCHSGSSEDCNRILKPLNSTSHRGWVLNHLKGMSFSLPHPHSTPQPQEERGSGLQISEGSGTQWHFHQSPAHLCLHPWAAYTLTHPMRSPLGSCSGLLHTWLRAPFSEFLTLLLTPPMTSVASMGTGVGCLQDLLILPRFHTQTQLPSLFHAPQNWMQTFTQTIIQSANIFLSPTKFKGTLK